MSTEWYLTDIRYYSGYEKEEIEKSYTVFDEFLSQSPEAYQVEVNGEAKDAIIQSTSNYNERRILFKHGEIKWGDIVIHEDEKWLVTERPFFNKIHDKSHIRLCNHVMKFKVKPEIIGYDDFRRPIYSDESSTEKEFVCVVEDSTKTDLSTNVGNKINIPRGMMVIYIPYIEDESIKLNSEFTIFNEKHYISGIDKSGVANGKGILMLIAEKK